MSVERSPGRSPSLDRGASAVVLATVLAIVGGLALWSAPAAAQEMTSYTVRPGDTCGSIARELYGSSRRYDFIHQHNPGLGPMPHQLEGGTVLRVPVTRVTSGADATVTAVQRQVNSQPPSAESWGAAQVGEELSRGWRVNTQERSSAELTFQSSSVAHVREQTLVIVYGDGARRVRREGARVEVREGSMLSRISALSGGAPLEVETPSALATLRTGEASVDVEAAGTTRVSVHEGDAATVARPNGAGEIRVGAGMGTTVAPGRSPTRPRPLPRAPRWDASAPSTFLSLGEAGGTVRGRWEAAPNAHRYRVEVARRSDGRDLLIATQVAAEVREVELHRLPPGSYFVRVSTIDEERFEGRPGRPTEITVVGLRVAAPGTRPGPIEPADPFGLDQLDSGLEDLDFEAASQAAPTVPRFSRLVLPDGVTCDGGAEGSLTLREVGSQELRCRSEGGATGPLALEVTDVALRVLGADGSEAALARGSEAALRFTVDGLDDLSGLTAAFSTPTGEAGGGARVVRVEPDRDGLTLIAAADAGAPDVVTLAIDTTDGEPIGRLEIPVRDAASVATAAPLPSGEATPSYPSVQETFGLAAYPSAVGLVDERRRGSAMHLGMSIVSAEEGDAEVRARLTAGLRAALFEDRLRIDVAVPLDLSGATTRSAQRGSRDVYAALSSLLLDEDIVGLAAEVGLFVPTAGDQGLDRARLRAAVDVSLRLLEQRLVLRTRQAGVFDLTDDGSLLWASAYGADFRVVGPFTAGVEIGLVLGREDAQDVVAGTAGLAVALDLDPIVVSLAGRVGFGDHALVGLGAGVLTVRGTYDLADL